MRTIRVSAPILALAALVPVLNAQISFQNLANTNNGGVASGITVSGNYAYLASGTNGLLIYDISNPAHPVKVGHPAGPNDTGLNATGVAVSGNFAILTTPQFSSHSLCVYDASNPAAPTNIYSTNLNLYAGGGVAAFGTNFFAGGDDLVAIGTVGLSNPPAVQSIFRPSFNYGNPVGIAAGSDFFALATGANGNVFVATFLNGVFTNVVATNVAAAATGVAVQGRNIYVANNSTAPLQAYNFGTNGALTKLGRVSYPGSPITGSAVAISGDYAYLAGFGGLRAVNIADPTNPVAAGQTTTNYGGQNLGVAVAGRYLYVASGTNGLRVFAIQPQLTVSNAPGNQITFSWPDQGPFALQQTPDIGNPSWVTLTNVPVNGQLILPAPTGNMFYRLVGQ